MVDTIKFSEMTDGGDIENNERTPGLEGGANVLFNNPWTFLAPGGTGERPPITADIYYRLRLNTTLESYEYYSPIVGDWVQLQDSIDVQSFPFIIYKAEPLLPDAFDLGTLNDGILKQTVTTGVATLANAINGTDYYGPGYTGYINAPQGIADINGLPIVKFNASGVGAVNYLEITNSPSGAGVGIQPVGGDADIVLLLTSAGDAPVYIGTQSLGEAVRFINGTSFQHNTNFIFANTAATRNVTFQDDDGTVAFLSDVLGTVTSAEGTANQVLVNGTSGSAQTGACIFTLPQSIATSSSPQFTNLTLTGANILGSNNHTVLSFVDVASAVNYWDFHNAIAGGSPFFRAAGTDTNIWAVMQGKGNLGTLCEGVKTDVDAPSGYIREFQSAQSGSPVNLTSGIAADLVVLPLTAGDWDLWGFISYLAGAGCTPTAQSGCIGLTSATITAPFFQFAWNLGNGSSNTLNVTANRIKIPVGGANVYIVGFSLFSGGANTMTGVANISARRR